MLNNKGWGLRMMIILTCVIIVFLLIASYFVVSLYGELNDNINAVNNSVNKEVTLTEQQKNYYVQNETLLNNSAIYYINTSSFDIREVTYKIKLSELVNLGQIKNIYDVVDNSLCEGYTLINYEVDHYVGTSYIKCKNYTTEGYED